ncbi:MAG TPA: ABC transporter [Ktedonobacter sp.]|jgi:ABC-2 type transport system ATP-binding protein|nr:ABC transporter [Ktedonobacter sp.]
MDGRTDNIAPAIEVKGLRKVYKSLVAVDNVSFTMYRGEAFGFLGPNGAGKSTVVKIMTGLVAPTRGEVRLLGRPLGDMDARRRIGYLPELPNFHKWLQAREFLEFHGRLYGLRGAPLHKRCREVLALVGLDGRDYQRLGTFSKGMMQRIGLAQALLNQPDLLLLDELVSGLDPVGQRDMRDLLRQLKHEGIAIFLNSHQLADVEVLCDRVAIINEGRILKVGAPETLFEEPLVLEMRVHPVSKELLQRLGTVALAVRQNEDDPSILLVEVRDEEGAADVASIVQECGARLYALSPHHRSLEQLFLQTIDASRNKGGKEGVIN